jgi:hypothetical protein
VDPNDERIVIMLVFVVENVQVWSITEPSTLIKSWVILDGMMRVFVGYTCDWNAVQ